MQKQFDSKSAIILGMHDALVSLTGLIAGLYFAFTNTDIIVISCIISSITASLSMGAANYLAVKTVNRFHAIKAALYTASAYMTTCVLLIFPFFAIKNQGTAFIAVLITAIFIIYFFNKFFYSRQNFYKHFFEMLIICTSVSLVAFGIGSIAKYFFGIQF